MLVAGTKFLLAPFIAELPPYNLNFWEAFTVTTVGGVAGVVTFVFFGDFVISKWSAFIYLIKRIYKTREQIRNETKHPKKKFNWRSRYVARVKRRFGLIGIAFVTPCIISIPIGSVVAVGFYKNKLKVLAYIFCSLIFWSFVLNILAQYFGISKYFVN